MKARWIWPIAFKHTLNSYVQFRHDFKLKAVPRKAPFYISADQSYVFYLNGKYVGRGPARGYQESWPYDEYDIAGILQKGNNWISVIAYNPAAGNFQYRFDGRAGFICAGQWGKTEVYSNNQWRCRFAPQYNTPQTDKLSFQLNYQEWVNAKQNDNSWISSSRAPKDETWKTVERAWPFGVMPWHDMEPRGIPNLTSDIIPYEKTQHTAQGKCLSRWQDYKNLFHPWFQEQSVLKWVPADKGRRTASGLEFILPKAGAGKIAAVSCDLTIPRFGTLIVEAEAQTNGETIDFFFTEGQSEDGRPLIGEEITDGCEASMVARIVLPKGKCRYEFFQMIGHRTVVAIARETKGDVKLKLSMRHCVYPFAIKGLFESGDEILNGIHRISVQTQQVCSLDSYVDTPWREQAQWWGDARVQAMNTFFMSGDTRLLTRGIRSIAQQEVPNGLTFGHAPTISYNCIIPDFSLIWIMTIWDYFYQTGKIDLFVEQQDRINRLLHYFENDAMGKNGLLTTDPRYWLFLDWTDIYREDSSSLYNLWYLQVLQKLCVLAEAASDTNAKKSFEQIRNRHEKRILQSLWDPKKKMFYDGVTTKGKKIRQYSVHTQVLAIMCGLKPHAHQEMIANCLLPYLRGEQLDSARPSGYWVTYVYDVMEMKGRVEDVLEHIRKNWKGMIPWEGCWEFIPDSNNQHCRFGNQSLTHAWSAHPIYHLTRIVAGIRQNDIAWKKIIFSPLLDKNIAHAKAVVPTPNGRIVSSWRYHQDKGFMVRLQLPQDVQATVMIPNSNHKTVTGTNSWIIPADPQQ